MPKLREADSELERESIYQFRYRVFSQHLHRSDLEGLDHSKRILSEPLDAVSRQFYFGKFGSPTAAITLSPLDETFLSPELADFLSIGRLRNAVDPRRMRLVNWLLVDPSRRGSSRASMFLTTCYEQLLKNDIDLLLTFCRPGLVAFYERLGLEQYSFATEFKGYGLRCALMLVAKDSARLKACRSPLLRVLMKSGREARVDETRQRLEPIIAQFKMNQMRVSHDFWRESDAKSIERPLPKLFDGVGDDGIRHIMKLASVISCRPGEVITRKGETSDDMFLIVSGTFHAYQNDNERTRQLGPGDLFGELEYLAAAPRKEIVKSTSQGHIVAMKADRIFQWMQTNPACGVKVAVNLAKLVAGRVT